MGLPLSRLAVRRPRESAERPIDRRPRAGGRQQLIFAFAVRRLKFLARIPGAPQIFDAMLLAATGVFHPARLRAISAIEDDVRRWPGMRIGVHRLGGIGFFFLGKECGHIHGNGLLDCFVGRTKRETLVRDGRALPHHIFPNSGWISFWIEDGNDSKPALELIRIATEAK